MIIKRYDTGITDIPEKEKDKSEYFYNKEAFKNIKSSIPSFLAKAVANVSVDASLSGGVAALAKGMTESELPFGVAYSLGAQRSFLNPKRVASLVGGAALEVFGPSKKVLGNTIGEHMGKITSIAGGNFVREMVKSNKEIKFYTDQQKSNLYKRAA